MDYLDLLGWIGNFFFFAGAIEIARKHRIGLLFNLIANLFYVCIGYFLQKSSIFVLSVALVVIDMVGFYLWSNKAEQKNSSAP